MVRIWPLNIYVTTDWLWRDYGPTTTSWRAKLHKDSTPQYKVPFTRCNFETGIHKTQGKFCKVPGRNRVVYF